MVSEGIRQGEKWRWIPSIWTLKLRMCINLSTFVSPTSNRLQLHCVVLDPRETPRGLVRVGFSTAGSSLILGESEAWNSVKSEESYKLEVILGFPSLSTDRWFSFGRHWQRIDSMIIVPYFATAWISLVETNLAFLYGKDHRSTFPRFYWQTVERLYPDGKALETGFIFGDFISGGFMVVPG